MSVFFFFFLLFVLLFLRHVLFKEIDLTFARVVRTSTESRVDRKKRKREGSEKVIDPQLYNVEVCLLGSPLGSPGLGDFKLFFVFVLVTARFDCRAYRIRRAHV